VVSFWRSLSVGARAAVIAAGVIVIVVVISVSAWTHNRARYTPTQAACEMMRQGDSPRDALRAMELMSGISDEVAGLQTALARYGYGVPTHGKFDGPTMEVVTAFQRHFRPARVDGIADHSTMSTLHALLASLPADAAPTSAAAK